MIVTVSFEGVLAEPQEGRPLTEAKFVPQGLALIQGLVEQHTVFVMTYASSEEIQHWLNQFRVTSNLPGLTILHLKEEERYEIRADSMRGSFGTILFHVTRSRETARAASKLGIASFLFVPAESSYPVDAHEERAWNEFASGV